MRRILRTLLTSSHLSQSQTPPQLRTRPLSSASKSRRRNSPRSQHETNEEEDDEQVDGRAKFQLHKSRGQHILTNPRVLDSIVSRAQVLPTDTVLEIGPGTGNLTVRLLESARRVVAVEIDQRMIETLEKRVRGLGLQDKLTALAACSLTMRPDRSAECSPSILLAPCQGLIGIPGCAVGTNSVEVPVVLGWIVDIVRGTNV